MDDESLACAAACSPGLTREAGSKHQGVGQVQWRQHELHQKWVNTAQFEEERKVSDGVYSNQSQV